MKCGDKNPPAPSAWARRDFLKAPGGLLLSSSAAAKAASKAPQIWTMKGRVACDRLGTTLMHEHVLFGAIPEDLRAASVEYAIKLLKEAARSGIDTLVDLTPVRDIELYRQIAGQVPVKIIASTGSYVFSRMPKSIQEMNEGQMYERMMREITEGIEGTQIRAGIIKIAANKLPFTDWEQAAFQAAARVQKATGTPIGTHAIFDPREQLDLLVKTGADPKRCFFSHIEAEFGWRGRKLAEEAEYLLSIAKEGGYLLFNNFGFEFDTPWPDLVFLIRYLCDKGYSNRVFISVDCNWEWKKGKVVFEASEKHPETAKRTYAYLMTDAVPALLKAGFSQKEIQIFLKENPQRFFRGL